MLSAWSYSRLTIFEQCRLRAKLAYVDKIPEPPRPLPPGKNEHADERGIRVHEAAERYVRGGVELLFELASFRDEFAALRTLYREGGLSLEEDWAFTKEWKPTAWNSIDAWLRVKTDAFYQPNEYEAVLIDYKTGRRDGNEIKHTEQGQLYAVAAFMRCPTLERIQVEFWYLDKDDLSRAEYSRDDALGFLGVYHGRGEKLTTATTFPANPNAYSCRYCPYGPRGTKHCSVGV